MLKIYILDEKLNYRSEKDTPDFNLDNINYGQKDIDETIAFLPSENMRTFPGNVQ